MGERGEETDKAERWVRDSWPKSAPIMYEMLHELLKPYELTIMRLDWRGNLEHSWLILQIWRMRVHMALFRICLEPVLQAAFYKAEPEVMKKVMGNIKAYLHNEIQDCHLWRQISYHDAAVTDKFMNRGGVVFGHFRSA